MLNHEKTRHLDLVPQNTKELSIRRTDEGLLMFKEKDQEEKLVSLVRCFPWSAPDRYLSLRDEDGQEVYLIETIDQLSPDNRMAILDSLKEEGFLFEVELVRSVVKEFELRTWIVETKQGVRKFQTSLTEWPMQLSGDRLLVKDVDGDLYLIEDLSNVEKKTREHIWAFIDQE